MTGARPAGRMQPVVLTDADDDEDASGPDDAPRRRGAPGAVRPGLSGARRWWPAALVTVALLAAGAVATHVVGRAADARADAIARVPGLVRPLDAAPVELWRAPATGRGAVVAAAGLLVTVAETPESWRVRGHEAGTGDVVWSVDVTAPARGEDLEPVVVTCHAGPVESDVVLCRWTDSRPVDRLGGFPVPPTHVLALDGRDGDRLGTWTVEAPVVGMRRIGDDLVVATVEDDRRVRVERRAGTDGGVVWSHGTPDRLAVRSSSRSGPSLTVAGGVVVLGGTAVTVLDTSSGDVVAREDAGRRLVVGPLPGGRFATWATGIGARLHDRDGRPGPQVRGVPTRLAADDGSLDVLLSDVGSHVLGLDPASGEVVWQFPTVQSPVAAVDGSLVLWGDEAVGVADGADGRLLWEQRLADTIPFAPLTDGGLVIGAEPDGAGGRALVGRGLRDGVRVWSVPLPPGVRALESVGGVLVARTEAEALVLGPR